MIQVLPNVGKTLKYFNSMYSMNAGVGTVKWTDKWLIAIVACYWWLIKPAIRRYLLPGFCSNMQRWFRKGIRCSARGFTAYGHPDATSSFFGILRLVCLVVGSWFGSKEFRESRCSACDWILKDCGYQCCCTTTLRETLQKVLRFTGRIWKHIQKHICTYIWTRKKTLPYSLSGEKENQLKQPRRSRISLLWY